MATSEMRSSCSAKVGNLCKLGPAIVIARMSASAEAEAEAAAATVETMPNCGARARSILTEPIHSETVLRRHCRRCAATLKRPGKGCQERFVFWDFTVSPSHLLSESGANTWDGKGPRDSPFIDIRHLLTQQRALIEFGSENSFDRRVMR